MTSPREFMEMYRTAFVQGDVDALVNCFDYPLHVISVAHGEASSQVFRDEEWRGVIEGLLRAYERLGVAECLPVTVQITQPMDPVAVACVHWALQREDRGPVYDFAAVYTLMRAGDQLRIAALAHDELPKMQARLQMA